MAQLISFEDFFKTKGAHDLSLQAIIRFYKDIKENMEEARKIYSNRLFNSLSTKLLFFLEKEIDHVKNGKEFDVDSFEQLSGKIEKYMAQETVMKHPGLLKSACRNLSIQRFIIISTLSRQKRHVLSDKDQYRVEVSEKNFQNVKKELLLSFNGLILYAERYAQSQLLSIKTLKNELEKGFEKSINTEISEKAIKKAYNKIFIALIATFDFSLIPWYRRLFYWLKLRSHSKNLG